MLQFLNRKKLMTTQRKRENLESGDPGKTERAIRNGREIGLVIKDGQLKISTVSELVLHDQSYHKSPLNQSR
jgi:hypothetical protein